MNWDAIGAISELLGVIVVIVTLLYLAQQISQSIKMSKTTAARELQQKYSDFYTLIVTDTEMRSLVTRLRQAEYEVQSEEEEEQLESFCLLLLGTWLSTGAANVEGQLEPTVYEVYCRDVEVKLAKWPGIKNPMKKTLEKYPQATHFDIFQPIFD